MSINQRACFPQSRWISYKHFFERLIGIESYPQAMGITYPPFIPTLNFLILFIPITYELIHYCHSPIPILYTVIHLVDKLSTRHAMALAAHRGPFHNATKSFYWNLIHFSPAPITTTVIFSIS